jgi:hypothetical protein
MFKEAKIGGETTKSDREHTHMLAVRGVCQAVGQLFAFKQNIVLRTFFPVACTLTTINPSYTYTTRLYMKNIPLIIRSSAYPTTLAQHARTV